MFRYIDFGDLMISFRYFLRILFSFTLNYFHFQNRLHVKMRIMLLNKFLHELVCDKMTHNRERAVPGLAS